MRIERAEKSVGNLDSQNWVEGGKPRRLGVVCGCVERKNVRRVEKIKVREVSLNRG